MSIRSIQRQVAKARLAAMDVGNPNKKMGAQRKDRNGKPVEEKLWKRVLFGDLSKRAFAAQMGERVRRNRKIRRVSK